MKVLSYNIHKGFATGNMRFVLHRIREVIELLSPDLVLLQEVLGEHLRHATRIARWPVQAQFEFLADRLWPHHVYGRNAVYQHGHHGNALLSRHPILSWENIDVSTNSFENRGMLHGVLDVPGLAGPLHVICLHLDLLESGRRLQLESLCARIAEHVPDGAPLLVGGDFNDWRERAGRFLEERMGLTEVHKALHGRHARSFPSWFPLLHLDRIYARGLEVRVAECLTGNPWKELSDHGALFAEFEIAAAEEEPALE